MKIGICDDEPHVCKQMQAEVNLSLIHICSGASSGSSYMVCRKAHDLLTYYFFSMDNTSRGCIDCMDLDI